MTGSACDSRSLCAANPPPLRIVVLQGGNSPEREVSLESGSNVTRSLRARGHEVIVLDPAETNLTAFSWADVDACFIALHGRFGEDGQVQQLLDNLGVAYTGSGPTASRLAMSKSATKERLGLYGIATPPYFLMHRSEDHAAMVRKAARLGYPLFVKPDDAGSSIGVTPVAREQELAAAIENALRYASFAVVERGVLGREMTVSVIGRTALPIVEILPTRPFFDYQAKYHDASTRYTLDVDLPREDVRRIEQLAVDVCAAVGTRGLCRVDVMLDRNHQPSVLEVNTIPGMTSHSLAPMAARRAGLDEQFCELLVLECLQRASVPILARASA